MGSDLAVKTAPNRTVPPTVSRPFEALLETFETDFWLWQLEESWRPIQPELPETFGSPNQVIVECELRSRNDNTEPDSAELADGRTLLIVPLAGPRKSRFAAVAVFDGHDEAIFQKLAAKTIAEANKIWEIEGLLDQCEAYAQQVSVDFEELTWLRGFVEHIEYCDVSNELENVAEKILSPLCTVIKAEAIVFVPVDRKTKTAEGQLPPVGWPTFRTGSESISDQDCQQLVLSFREDARLQPVVQNHLNQHHEFSHVPGLYSCMIIPVTKANELFGWVLSINRLKNDGESWGLNYHPEDISEDEFGTIEASLLGAAAVMLASHARNVDLFRSKERLLIGVIRSMINSLDAKDAYTCGHSDRVARMGKRIAEQMGIDPKHCEQLYMSGLLHDIGKIGVSDAVLGKPGRLTAEEFDEIKKHPVIGYEILKHLDQISYVLPGVLYHHEQIDGRGYPDGLKGDEIPLFGRILAVADAYDAMTSDRPYRNGMPYEKAESILMDGAGTQWDNRAIEAFFSALNDMHSICEKSQEHTQALLRPGYENTFLGENNSSDLIVAAVTATHNPAVQNDRES